MGLASGYGFWPVLEVEGEREVGGFVSDGWVLAVGMGMAVAFFFFLVFPLVMVDL